MKVNECMTRSVHIGAPDESIREAAKAMAELDAGVLPVGENDRLVGMVTDRDIVIRGIAQGGGPETKIRDVMTRDVRYCYEDQDVDEVLQNMGELQVRRLAVLNRNKRLVGIISVADMVGIDRAMTTAEAVTQISETGGPRSQTAK